MMDITNGLLLGTTVFLGGIVLIVLRPGRRHKHSPDLEVSIPISLDELSEIWDRARKNGKVKIEDLAPIWREVKESAGNQRKDYRFQNEKITAFFHTHIYQASWFRKAPLQTKVCYQILLYLEKEGIVLPWSMPQITWRPPGIQIPIDSLEKQPCLITG